MKKLFITLLLFSFAAHAVTNLKDHVTFSATTTSGQALSLNQYRNYLLIQNRGTADIYVKANSAHAGSEGILIVAGGSWEPLEAPIGAIFIKASTGTQSTAIVEGIK